MTAAGDEGVKENFKENIIGKSFADVINIMCSDRLLQLSEMMNTLRKLLCNERL